MADQNSGEPSRVGRRAARRLDRHLTRSPEPSEHGATQDAPPPAPRDSRVRVTMEVPALGAVTGAFIKTEKWQELPIPAGR